MNLHALVIRLSHVTPIVLMLGLAASVSGYSQAPAPPKDIAGFFHEIIGEWIGTAEQYTGGIKADTRYFHAVAKQTGPDTYEAVFEYFRLDEKTHAPVQVGVTRMTTKITPEGTATNTIVGEGEVSLDPHTRKPEKNQLSEVLRMSPSGSLEGKGHGIISVGDTALGLGKNGKVSEYTSTWVLHDGVLSISERLRVTFRILFFARHYDIVDSFRAIRGSDVMSLMKSAGANPNPSPAPISGRVATGPRAACAPRATMPESAGGHRHNQLDVLPREASDLAGKPGSVVGRPSPD